MPQWEYIKIDLNSVSTKTDDVHLLNSLGNDGWELVGVTVNNIAYLKRASAEQPASRSQRRKPASPPPPAA